MIKVIKEDSRKLNAIAKELRAFKRSYVKVGVLEGTTTDDGLNQAQIAVVHEYGSRKRNIPKRSFLRSWVAENKNKVHSFIEKLIKSVEDGALTADTALKQLGLFGANGVKTKIKKGPFAVLKIATVRRKHSSKPLIDTGGLRRSINFKVFKR